MDRSSEAPPSPNATGRPPAPGWQGTWRFTLAPEERSVPQARHAVRDLLRRRAAPLTADRLHGLLLILTELVTNAVRHAALLTPTIGVEVAVDAHWVWVRVEDGHPYRPHALAASPERQRTGGRGLLLVQATAHESGGSCGVRATADGGKVIWAVLPLDRIAGGPPPLPPS
ncbi:ATP-binding protein [Streptomyces sp. 3MP-14]|uniref:ATP-binding protein n=1 Tax=Streptomyces mimosae TaxID=2586635 RepID=A0A5N6AFJ5_9ACTN|nr:MULTISPECIES: ATP-binding protein [Streptomyces]KAB8166559.1 ATP-binding protein [Streptomyces mimosae]KAB8179251.1 ATP-binding protein [Streptomyces sp. 3MP-14]